MSKIFLIISVLTLILVTSLVKNSTKEIEDKIFTKRENIRSLKSELSVIMLEYNFLSSPEKLLQYQSEYFINNLKKIDINNVKVLSLNNDYLEVSDFIKKINIDE